jgi:hypothetical protein
MQTPQHALVGAGVVVLHKIDVEAGGLLKCPLVIALEEKASGVAKDFGLNEENIR